MNESAGGSLKSDSMSCVRPGASLPLTHAQSEAAARRGKCNRLRAEETSARRVRKAIELMQLTVETKMSTAMEVRRWASE